MLGENAPGPSSAAPSPATAPPQTQGSRPMGLVEELLVIVGGVTALWAITSYVSWKFFDPHMRKEWWPRKLDRKSRGGQSWGGGSRHGRWG